MKCETLQNRLLAVADPRRLPDDVRAHVTECQACRVFHAKLVRLEGLLVAVPVPVSTDAKAALLDQVAAPGPIITRIPTVPRRDSSATIRALVAKTGRWKYVAGLAAGVMLAVCVWLAGGNRQPAATAQAAVPHQLLKSEVGRIVALRNAEKPGDRALVLADLAADLRGEARALYLAAQDAEMKKLAGLYEKTVSEGVVKQVDGLGPLTPVAERAALVRRLDDKLAADEAEATVLAAHAPPQSIEGLTRIAKAARAGREALASGAPVRPASPGESSPALVPLAADEIRLFRANLTLLDGLLADGLAVAAAQNDLDRAEAYRKTAWTLAAAVRAAAADPVPGLDRVAELSDHLSAVVEHGLAPTLATARRQTHPGSPGYTEFLRVHTLARQDLADTQLALNGGSAFDKSAKVRDARARLADAAGCIGTPD